MGTYEIKKEVQEVSASYNGVDGCLSSTLEHQVASHHQSSNKNKKVEVIDLTIDSSSDEEEEEPSAKRTCPSLSPTSPLNNKGILSLPHQASPVSRTPSLPAVDTSYINTSLIQDYRHPFHMTPMPYDLQGLDFFPFLSGDNQHYNTSSLLLQQQQFQMIKTSYTRLGFFHIPPHRCFSIS